MGTIESVIYQFVKSSMLLFIVWGIVFAGVSAILQEDKMFLFGIFLIMVGIILSNILNRELVYYAMIEKPLVRLWLWIKEK